MTTNTTDDADTITRTISEYSRVTLAEWTHPDGSAGKMLVIAAPERAIAEFFDIGFDGNGDAIIVVPLRYNTDGHTNFETIGVNDTRLDDYAQDPEDEVNASIPDYDEQDVDLYVFTEDDPILVDMTRGQFAEMQDFMRGQL